MRAERGRRWKEEDMARKVAAAEEEAARKRAEEANERRAARKQAEEEIERREAASEARKLEDELNARRAAADNKVVVNIKKFCKRQEMLEQFAAAADNGPAFPLVTIDEGTFSSSQQGSADCDTRSKLQAMKPLPNLLPSSPNIERVAQSPPVDHEDPQLDDGNGSLAAFTRYMQRLGGHEWEEFAKLDMEAQKAAHAKYCHNLLSPRLVDCTNMRPKQMMAKKSKPGPTLEHVLPLIKPEVAKMTSGMRRVREEDFKREIQQPLLPSMQGMLWGYIRQNFELDLTQDEVKTVADLLKTNQTIPSTKSDAFRQLIEIVLNMTRKPNGYQGQLHVEYGRPGSNMLVVHTDAGTQFLDLNAGVVAQVLGPISVTALGQ